MTWPSNYIRYTSGHMNKIATVSKEAKKRTQEKEKKKTTAYSESLYQVHFTPGFTKPYRI
jgi:hypothetical protein